MISTTEIHNKYSQSKLKPSIISMLLLLEKMWA